jgi:hypothetical protein
MTTPIRWLLILLLLTGAHAVRAEESAPSESEAQGRRTLVANKLLGPREEAPAVELVPSRPDWMDVVQIEKGTGFALRQSFSLREHDVIFRLRGPVMKQNRFGLTVEFKF